MNIRLGVFGAVTCVAVASGVRWYQATPLQTRDWLPEQTILASVITQPDGTLLIKNVRNFTYQSETAVTPGYYDTVVSLDELEGVDYFVEPFGLFGAAHTFLSFGFRGGQHIVVSVETRREVGESFSALWGLFRGYELIYVIADERDALRIRVLTRGHDVYRYPSTATPEQARALFVSMLRKATNLETQPEFYNTLTNNCATNIAEHVEIVTETAIPYSYLMLLPSHSDRLAESLGFIAPFSSTKEARVTANIRDEVMAAGDSPDFSNLIRGVASVTE